VTVIRLVSPVIFVAYLGFGVVDVRDVDNVLNTDYIGGVSRSGDSLDISGDSPSIDHSVSRSLVQQSSCVCTQHTLCGDD
jgi:hypothetical protein